MAFSDPPTLICSTLLKLIGSWSDGRRPARCPGRPAQPGSAPGSCRTPGSARAAAGPAQFVATGGLRRGWDAERGDGGKGGVAHGDSVGWRSLIQKKNSTTYNYDIINDKTFNN